MPSYDMRSGELPLVESCDIRLSGGLAQTSLYLLAQHVKELIPSLKLLKLSSNL
jgi:hypothetical protein